MAELYKPDSNHHHDERRLRLRLAEEETPTARIKVIGWAEVAGTRSIEWSAQDSMASSSSWPIPIFRPSSPTRRP